MFFLFDMIILMNVECVFPFQEKEPPSLDLSDDEDLAQAFDMHSLIVSSLHPEEEDKVLTADEVISEIDDMMKVRVSPTVGFVVVVFFTSQWLVKI